MLKREGDAQGFQHLQRDLLNVNASKTMFDPYIIFTVIFCTCIFRTGMFILTPDRGLPEVARCQKRGHHEHTKHPPVFEVSLIFLKTLIKSKHFELL